MKIWRSLSLRCEAAGFKGGQEGEDWACVCIAPNPFNKHQCGPGMMYAVDSGGRGGE